MAINEYLDTSLLDELLTDWAAATGMIAVVLDDEGGFLSNVLGFSRDNIEAFGEDIEVDEVVVASVVGGPLDEDTPEEQVEAASKLLVSSIQNLLERYYNKQQLDGIKDTFSESISDAAGLIKELRL